MRGLAALKSLGGTLKAKGLAVGGYMRAKGAQGVGAVKKAFTGLTERNPAGKLRLTDKGKRVARRVGYGIGASGLASGAAYAYRNRKGRKRRR